MPGIYRNRRALELGSGTGLVGMALAALGATVTLTDQKYCLPLLQHNVDRNFKSTIFDVGAEGAASAGTSSTDSSTSSSSTPEVAPAVRELLWGQQPSAASASASASDEPSLLAPFDIVVATDVLYSSQHDGFASLLQVREQMLVPKKTTVRAC